MSNLGLQFASHQNPNSVYREPHFSDIVFQGSFDNTNAGTNNTVIDSGSVGATVTRVGSPVQGSVSPYSPMEWSAEFLPAATQYLTVGPSSFLDFTGDFTAECYFYPNAVLAQQDVMGNVSGAATAADWAIACTATGGVQVTIGTNVAAVTSATGIIIRNFWNHLAISRIGTNLRLFVNGVLQGTLVTGSTIGDGTRAINIGSRRSTTPNYLAGHVAGLRILSGGFYEVGFVVPWAPFKNTANTVFLLSCTTYYTDLGPNNLTIGAVNGPNARPISPYAPSAPYNSATHGGSIRLGATDYLTCPQNANYRFGNSPFTVEGWFYPLSFPTEATLVSKWNNTGSLLSNNWILQMLAGVATFKFSTDGTNATATVTGPAMRLGQWNHVAVCRVGNVFTVYVNGVAGTSVTNTGSLYALEAEALGIGFRNNNGGTLFPFLGFFMDVRINKGNAVYTAPFSPPKTRLTAITGTVCLISCVNAQVIDLACKSNIITSAAGCSISTTHFKYGTAALSLTGTGSATGLANTLFGFGTGDFTIEGDLYLNALTAQTIISFYTTTASVAPHVHINATGILAYGVANTDHITTPANTLVTAAFHEFALSRVSGVTRMFLDGVQVGSSYTDTNDYGSSNPIGFGDFGSGANRLNAFLDNVRIMRHGLYAANYTPKSIAFAVQ